MVDSVVEPARANLIPGFHQVKERALKAGACGVAISGAGPAILAIINATNVKPLKVAHAMEEGFKSVGLETTSICTKPGRGVAILEAK